MAISEIQLISGRERHILIPALYRNLEEQHETRGIAVKEIRAYIQIFMLSRLKQTLLEGGHICFNKQGERWPD